MDGIPAEFWKAVAAEGSPAAEWVLHFCNSIRAQQRIPDAWRLARVSSLYKKGDPGLCDNYRPISFLAVGYKLFAMMLLHRLKAGGAEKRLWQTQFGFKSGCGTSDALFIVRRILEEVRQNHMAPRSSFRWIGLKHSTP